MILVGGFTLVYVHPIIVMMMKFDFHILKLAKHTCTTNQDLFDHQCCNSLDNIIPGWHLRVVETFDKDGKFMQTHLHFKKSKQPPGVFCYFFHWFKTIINLGMKHLALFFPGDVSCCWLFGFQGQLFTRVACTSAPPFRSWDDTKDPGPVEEIA